MDERLKHSNGITLVALVITIIILLILATISIQSLTNTGLFKNAEKAREVTEEKTAEEKTILDSYEEEMGKATGAKEYIAAQTIAEAQTEDMLAKKVNSSITDAYGNKITVPAGFKIKVDATTNNATTVNQGIVIVDSNENEFVWIPVGKIYTDTAKTDANAKTIELGRYEFDANGIKSAYSGSYVEEDKGNTSTTLKNYGNTIAKNITNFKNSVTTNGGYYIGRYEARTTTARKAKTDEITPITVKGTEQVYNYVTQLQAAQLAQNMYNSNKFTSDLMNSYAWDTATLFLQTCGTNATYSRKNTVNTTLSQTGTNTESTKDVQCNVYDMASNVLEWTTETSNTSDYTCVNRGGSYGISRSFYTSYRNYGTTSNSTVDLGFRPLLFVNI